MTIKRLAPPSLVLAALALGPACSDSDGTDSTLTVDNQSDFDITDLFVTTVDSPDWGPDLLDEDLQPGDTIDVDVTCDTWDVKLVDSDGVECELHGVDLCFSDAAWVIDNGTCSVFRRVPTSTK